MQGKYESVCRGLERTNDELENVDNFLRMHNTSIKAQINLGTPFPEVFEEAVQSGMGDAFHVTS